jgi:hypothetical protein
MILPTLLVCFATLGIPLEDGVPGPGGLPGTEVTNAKATVDFTLNGVYEDSVVIPIGDSLTIEFNTCHGYSLDGNVGAATITAHAQGAGFQRVKASGTMKWLLNPTYLQEHNGTYPSTITGNVIVQVSGKTNLTGETAQSSASGSTASASGSTSGQNGTYSQADACAFTITVSYIEVENPQDPTGPKIEVPIYQVPASVDAEKWPG